jgi:transcription elongation factor Elf1
MTQWLIICQTETCPNTGLQSSFVTETNDMPEIVCGACGNQYTDITILEGGN